METSTTTSDTFRAQWPLAQQALGVHAQKHQLPAPWTIDFRAPRIYVHLNRGDHEVWLATVVVDAERNEERQPGGVEAIRTEWDVRLPDTGFRFTLVSYRAMPLHLPLQAVAS